jgi:anti-sigma B factor antagonist
VLNFACRFALFSANLAVTNDDMSNMDNISISLSETGQRRDISEVRIDGVIDTITAGELEEVIDSLLKRSRYRIVIDLAGVDYISSAGWGIFISHIKEVREKGGDIKLANMIPNVHEIYELLEFDNVLQAFNSVDTARDKFDAELPPDGGKKKGSEVTRLTVFDNLLQGGRDVSGSGTGGADEPGGGDFETAVLRLVKEDPFLTISEMKAEIRQHLGTAGVGWWGVFSVLKRHHLLRKRARFRFARGRR